MKIKLPIVVLISGNGSNLQAIINAIQHHGLAVEIRAVISNRKDAYGLERAQKHRIPTEILPHNEFSDRSSFEWTLQKTIDKYCPKLILLAGFIRKLSGNFVRRYAGRILNVHPSLLPQYPGLNTHSRVLSTSNQEHGVSIHYVTEFTDGGPIICQAKLFVLSSDTPESLCTRVHFLEHIAYPQVLSWITNNRLTLLGNSVLLDQEILPKTGKQIKITELEKFQKGKIIVDL
ncbi:phosphoribosylglycinamide formyltransferase [Coxiella endosymbiont of Amblyomma sculptum]|uniref:phosphoribosylglycinamide formyltransferase n=1 Tax=Coxiella endosymbiont of Amblyomma sculptum TaxID=2487929 RepID=UPI001FE828C6|nr:phosphoribosylglycinamide formyltransferase [Coxiella endosymbiont of Amblyomma sculptum]